MHTCQGSPHPPVRLRQARIPAAFAVAILALAIAVGTAALGVSRSRPVLALAPRPANSAAARPATITYHEPDQSGALISLDAARQSVRQFTGMAALTLDGGLEHAQVGNTSYAVYDLETADNPRGAESYKVDARTGEVLEMTRPAPGAPSFGAPELDPVEAEQRAEQFAATHFLGFKALSLVEQSTTTSPHGGQLYSYKWAMIAPESGAELPTSVSVALAAPSGEIVWYLAQRESVAIETRPAIDRPSAVAAAAAQAELLGDWDTRTPLSVRLQIIFDNDNRQQLVWAVVFSGRGGPTTARPRLRILIDARTGEPLTGLP